jgi:hypothetical protein
LTSDHREPPEQLLTARRALDGIKGVTLLEDWRWYESEDEWVLHCQFTPGILSTEHLPETTNWYITSKSTYPWGSIKVHPSKKNGIAATFPHQAYNGEIDTSIPWREGALCLDTSIRALGRVGYDCEPYGIHERLAWHVRRALIWLTKASVNQLLEFGDPFEMPAFSIGKRITVVGVSEHPRNLSSWRKCSYHFGLAEFAQINDNSLAVVNFYTLNQEIVKTVKWGTTINGTINRSKKIGAWILLNEVPVLPPWQAPVNWGELKQACRKQEIDILDVINELSTYLRDGMSHIVLLGYPIPKTMGGASYQVYWQAFKLPILSRGSKTANGFRTNETGYWQRDKVKYFTNKTPIEWTETVNWNKSEFHSRGQIDTIVGLKSTLLIGAGAVGSVLSEMLVRAGLEQLGVMDIDFLEMANLVRHTLSMNDLNTPKALALAKHLNLVSPHACIESYSEQFPPISTETSEAIQQYAVILEATGSDHVLRDLASYQWENKKTFISISLGLGGKRMFIFSMYGKQFLHEEFVSGIHGWLQQEIDEYDDGELPRDGVGCWHPAFPARIDDVWLHSAAAIKTIEAIVACPPEKPTLIVFEQICEEGEFRGVRMISREVLD